MRREVVGDDTVAFDGVAREALDAMDATVRSPPPFVGGRYRLLSAIGEGGVGVVFEAEHVELGKRVALKLLRGFETRDEEMIERFKREARSESLLENDHVVQVFDAGEDEELGLFLVMELLRGEDLERALASRGRLNAALACAIAYQACRGLESAHERGVVHRDLKPANLFLARTGAGMRVKILDFGIAKLLCDARSTVRRRGSRAGLTLGTPEYMSPEQARGQEPVDERTDVYSLGAVLYEMLVGKPLVPDYPSYEQTITHVAMRLAPRVSESIPEIAPDLDRLVASMLAPRELRVGSISVVRERLARICPEIESARASLPPHPRASGVLPIRTIRLPHIVVRSGARASSERLLAVVASLGVLVLLLSIAVLWRVVGN